MKKIRVLLLAFLALLLAGCSLARPEADRRDGDPFVGFYVVREDGGRAGFFDNPNLSEYGSAAVEAEGYGTFAVPREVLFAEQRGREYVFPGLEGGYSLFLLRKTMENGNASTEVVSNMAPGGGFHTTVTDNGTSDALSGVIYAGPPLGEEDWDPNGSIWAAYRVFQAPDGRPYLDGSGNSVQGFGGAYSETQTRTGWENGGVVQEDTLSVEVAMEAVPRLERLVVTEFDAKNQILYSGDLIRDELPDIRCGAETAWVLVEEHTREGVERTLYNVPAPGEEPVSHPVVVLDEKGLGHLEYLQIS